MIAEWWRTYLGYFRAATVIVDDMLTSYVDLALLLGLHYMKDNAPCFDDGSRGSIVLISSTSGYFGGTGVTAYVTSKHAVTGLLRSSQREAARHNIRVNGVAPFSTPSNMSAGFSREWIKRGLEANTPEGVARVVGTIAMDDTRSGCCYLVGTLQSLFFFLQSC